MTTTVTGRTALVTGASSGIGEGVAVALAAAGVKVAVTARRDERLHELVGRIEAAGGEAIALPGDVADAGTATRIVEDCARQFGRLDVLVNAAGVMAAGGVETADFDDWRRVMDINLFSILSTCKAAIAVMKDQQRGDIVNISSTTPRRVSSGTFGPYSTSKAALVTLTDGLRNEAGRYGIRVCNLEPGPTTSEVAQGLRDPKLRDAVHGHVTGDKSMKPEDIGATVVFLVGLPQRANVGEIWLMPTGLPL